MSNFMKSITLDREQREELEANALKPNAECRTKYFKRRFAAFIPYDILSFGFDCPNGRPFDIRLWALFSSACWTAKTSKYSCNFWLSTLADYFHDEKVRNYRRTFGFICQSLKRLQEAEHISYSIKESKDIVGDNEVSGGSLPLKDHHLEITLSTRFDQSRRKVILGKDSKK